MQPYVTLSTFANFYVLCDVSHCLRVKGSFQINSELKFTFSFSVCLRTSYDLRGESCNRLKLYV